MKISSYFRSLYALHLLWGVYIEVGFCPKMAKNSPKMAFFGSFWPFLGFEAVLIPLVLDELFDSAKFMVKALRYGTVCDLASIGVYPELKGRVFLNGAFKA